MKILHVLSSLDQRDGGPIRALLDLSAACLDFGLDSWLIGPGPVSIDDNPLPKDRIHPTGAAYWMRYRYSADFRSLVRRHVADCDGVVIHGMWLYPGVAAALECTRARVPYACFPHGMLDIYPVDQSGAIRRLKKHAYWHLVERHLFRRAEAVLFTTSRERKNAEATFNVPNRKLIVMPYGVSGTVLRSDEPANATLKQPPDRRVALFLGRVHPKKNVEFLLRAWNAAPIPDDYHLVIAGPCDPQYLAQLKLLATAGPYSGRIHFTGYVAGADKAYLLSRASWFLLPSLQENFGVAVLEAVQAGTPVAISDQVYLADHFRADSAVLPLKFEDWVHFFATRMPDEARRSETVRLDHEWFAKHFSRESVNRRWAEALHEIFGNCGN